jgi:formyltetrahydrofolate deformylase
VRDSEPDCLFYSASCAGTVCNHGERMPGSAILLVHCPDQKGIVAKIAGFLYAHGANILHADQHQDHDLRLFFMRVEWELTEFDLDETGFHEEFEKLADRFHMKWQLAYSAVRPAIAIFVSQYQHCLLDLLYRHRIGELRCEIPMIVSNHTAARELAGFYDIPFHYLPMNGDKTEVENEQLALAKEHGIELIVLARYMQVLSAEFVAHFPQRIINVHHSFLPAFVGARPYHAAYHRGVKLIGATSHYVTEVLDDGPIIEQDVARVSHRDQIDDLIQKGRDLERVVLSRAVRWYLERRILHYPGKTVIFD